MQDKINKALEAFGFALDTLITLDKHLDDGYQYCRYNKGLQSQVMTAYRQGVESLEELAEALRQANALKEKSEEVGQNDSE